MSFFVGSLVQHYHDPDYSPSFVNACITNVSSVNACITYGTFHNISCDTLSVLNFNQQNIQSLNNVSFVNSCITNASMCYVNIMDGNVSLDNACITNVSILNACITTLVTNNVQNYGTGSLIMQVFNLTDYNTQGKLISKQLISDMNFDQSTTTYSTIYNIDQATSISVRVSGYICPLVGGVYYFYCNSFGACKLTIGNNFVGQTLDPTINNNQYLGTMQLYAVAWYPFVFEYSKKSSGAIFFQCTSNMDNGASRNTFSQKFKMFFNGDDMLATTLGSTFVNGPLFSTEGIVIRSNPGQDSNNTILANASLYVAGPSILRSASIVSASITNACINNLCSINCCINNASIINACITNVSIKSACIANVSLVSACISNVSIASACVANVSIASACISNVSIASACVANVSIASACISNVSIASACVANVSIASACISNVSIASACISNVSIASVCVANVSIASACIANVSITSTCIANVSITSACIANVSIKNACIANVSIVSACISNVSIASACISNVSIASACVANLSLASACIGNVSITNACITNVSSVNACITTLVANNVQNYGTGSLILQIFNGIQGMLLTKQLISDMNFDQNNSTISNVVLTQMCARVSGFICPTVTSLYYFYCNSYGSCRLYIGNQLVGQTLDPMITNNQYYGCIYLYSNVWYPVMFEYGKYTLYRSLFECTTNMDNGTSRDNFSQHFQMFFNGDDMLVTNLGTTYVNGPLLCVQNVVIGQNYVTNTTPYAFEVVGNSSFSTTISSNASINNACITNVSIASACIANASVKSACISNVSIASACITNLSCVTACITSISNINACITNLSCVNAYMTGNVYAYNGYYIGNVFTGYSDDRLKIRDSDMSDCLAKLKSLSTFKYYPNTSVCKVLGVQSSNDLDIGMSAQEVQEYFPEVVSRAPCDVQVNESTGEIISKTGQDLLTIRYERLTPIIIQAIKELVDLYETLNSRIK